MIKWTFQAVSCGEQTEANAGGNPNAISFSTVSFNGLKAIPDDGTPPRALQIPSVIRVAGALTDTNPAFELKDKIHNGVVRFNFSQTTGYATPQALYDFLKASLCASGGGGASDPDVARLRALSGTVSPATDLGLFPGNIIPDASTMKGALQALETAIEGNGEFRGVFANAAALSGATAPVIGDTAFVTDTATLAGGSAGMAGHARWSGSAWTVFNQSPAFYGDFVDDDTAGTGGVPIGGIYFLTSPNRYGMTEGVAKKRYA